MRILTFCDYPVYMSFYRALSDVGNYVSVCDLNNIKPDGRYKVMIDMIDKVKPDVIFTVGRPEIINGLNVEDLRDICNLKGIFNVYWATEDRTYHQKYSMKMAKNFDFIFTPAIECIQNYNRIGKGAALLRYGCYPMIHRNCGVDKKLISDISIAASYHDGVVNDEYTKKNVLGKQNDGEEMLRRKSIDTIVLPLIKSGYNISIWGSGWEGIVPSKYIKGYLPYEQIPLLYSSSKIVLGLEWDNISSTKTTGRPFEVLGCSSFFLTFRTKSLLNLFEDRQHLALSESAKETLDIVKYYLNNDKERNHIANEGQREVYSKHTYYNRAEEFMNSIYKYL
ncbi:CgeB family protein [Tepidibacter mesophilus]|uniref:CgeB family protein n=1 Tax=Tepidibacter mesophilus TaxID=655607 RepID=UPI000C06E274|nr:glycosyltransferase [Tepidibacter mesophilus]